MKEKLQRLWKKLREEILNARMLMWLIIAEAIFWSPCIVGVVPGALITPWCFIICTAYMAFWALPLTPAIPIQLGLAYGLKKLTDYFRKETKVTKRKPAESKSRLLDGIAGDRRHKFGKT